MFDDVHNLARSQRADLLGSITKLRAHYPVWIGERLTSLTERETLIDGADQYRDYNIINLDNIESNNKDFKQFVESIIRARMDLTSIGGFDTWLTINAIERNRHCKRAYEGLLPKIKEIQSRGKFTQWFERDDYEQCEPTFSLVVEMQSLLTSVAKYLNKTPSWPMFEESIENKPKADLAFVEYFLYSQYKVPYYIGSDVLTRYSTASLFEVLQIAECFFEAIYKASMKQAGSNTQLKITVQQNTVKALAREKFEKLSGVVRFGDDARSLLNNFALEAFLKSNKESSPYVPSITGFGLSDADMSKLVNDEKYHKLNCILTDLRKYNFVTIRKPKNKETNVFYLNRLLCAHFDLAGGYGGWNKFSLTTLQNWLSESHHVIKKDTHLSSSQGELDYE